MNKNEYIPIAVACISGLLSLLGTFLMALRQARTNREVETLKSKLAVDVEERKALLAHRTAVDLANRKSKLERINHQLKQLYGPLYALSNASHRAWVTFRTAHRPGGPFFDDDDKPTETDIKAWRLWMATVFMPLNIEMERLVLSNMDLLYGETMDECLVDLCAHVEAYKTVIERWKADDFSVHYTPIDFPGDALRQYVGERFTELKREQQRLLSDVYDYSNKGRGQGARGSSP